MQEGDSLLIVEGKVIKLMGKIALKVRNPRLSEELWQPLTGSPEDRWDLVYFIANPMEIDVPFAKFCELFGYRPNWQLRGLTIISQANIAAFDARYDDLYSILVRIAKGQHFESKAGQPITPPPPPPAAEGPAIPIGESVTSEHTRMQCALAKLGVKAGQKVWIPASDQQRVRKFCDFEDFEKKFSAGIDLPIRYVENIDVVWKEEFRIDAAFEVENSTGIYSGLLRFADLSVVAPNSNYPMFIVAPAMRQDEVRRQVLRPAFDRLKMRDRVLFLPYEEIDQIERFFGSSDSGPSADVMRARAQKFT